ncbi:MAG: MBL fold metallo-hydrolase [Candidatus Pacebacteria bacterium]|nr:MBL fold metallo-hydrolase [Candidatus Paceibacterota bacterium]MCF7857396.1 MBL fold metallo-hydrolase [Candidatus Paceibacterota bacterium]
MSYINFYGGAGSVTGANFLLDVEASKILVDCGLVQGDRFSSNSNSDEFAYNPAEVDVLLVTHAHADHIGRIPKLVRDGFKGVIYSTPPTRDLANVMLHDAYKVMLYEEERFGNPRIFEEKDIDRALSLWKTSRYQEDVALPGGVSACFTDAGHILGSAMVTLTRGGKKFLFTGDIGNIPQPLMNPPEVVEDYDYLLMESVYGDRTHEEVKERTNLLRMYIEDTIKKQGTLIIPAFSLERTQGMLFEINNFFEQGDISPIPVFLDSPLAINVTEIYKRYTEYLKDDVQEQIKSGDDIFNFPRLSFTRTVKDSHEIEEVRGAKIIIAGSGMSHGGRILGHEKKYLEDPKTTLLLVGYQAVGSLGRLLHDGAKKVRILGTDVKVKAKIAKIRGYSGHADRDQLVELVAKGCNSVKKVFVTMGEERASLFLVQRLRDYLSIDANAPVQGESIKIDF